MTSVFVLLLHPPKGGFVRTVASNLLGVSFQMDVLMADCIQIIIRSELPGLC